MWGVSGGNRPVRVGGRAKGWDCAYYGDAPGSYPGPAPIGRPIRPVDGQIVRLVCWRGGLGEGEIVYDRYLTYQSRQPLSGLETGWWAAQIARRRLTPPAPRLALSPPADRVIVGFPVWLAVRDWRPSQASVTLGGITGTVRATPKRVVWETDADETIVCDHPGIVWRQGMDPLQRSDCEHVWQDSGTHRLTATIHWTVDWWGSDGTSGRLPDITTTGNTTVTAHQYVPLITDD